MRINLISFLVLVVLMASCSPYRGFKGVNDKGMKNNEMPSQTIRDDYKKSEKRMKRKFKREMKKRAKRMGTTKKR